MNKLPTYNAIAAGQRWKSLPLLIFFFSSNRCRTSGLRPVMEQNSLCLRMSFAAGSNHPAKSRQGRARQTQTRNGRLLLPANG